ncbi:type VII secretion protein EssC [Paenibacillus sp. EKM211P]|uniref:type VII secretion protein EssC n=1 Tax=Paenibacillus sp. EKM211P TaxID=1683679 RepID=UPI0013E90B00|nr:type VII secretion protein EssC [Paenibacillus sp. EKM211P]KAF6580622.1 type VII secretion protein EssC [Paenibacillus sp. EKM211P]
MNVLYQRSPRLRPALREEKLEILRPPAEPSKPSFSIISILIPLMMTLVTIGFYVYMSRTGKMGNSNYLMFQMVTVVMMLTSYTIPFFVYLNNKKEYKRKLEERDRMYREQLQKHREELKMKREEQVRTLYEIHGDPQICTQIVKNRNSSLWERSPEDEDFLQVRIGTGQVPFHIKLQIPRPDGYDRDPLLGAADELEEEFRLVDAASITLPLFQSKVIGLVGEREHTLAALRVILAQVTVRHSPDEVKIASFYDEREESEWTWMRWLPHVWDDDRIQRMMSDRSSSAHQLADFLFARLNRRKNNRNERQGKGMEAPCYVIVLSDTQLIEEEPLLPLLLEDGRAIDACTIVLASRKEALPMQCQLIVEASKEQGVYALKSESAEVEQQSFKPDRLSKEEADALARYMAPIRLKRSSASDIPAVLPLFDMMSVASVEELDVADRWRRNRHPDTLPVPMGVRAGGKKIMINLHDKIERQGHGPHGLIAGTTGSGKSEVIQSIVASLAAEFHPHDLAFMLIDYKGGGMSNTFVNLPHVVGTITNLDNNLIERAKISLKAELVRRQKILNDAGNLQHIDEYYRLLRQRQEQPLPHLVIIIDEFAQLKRDQPEFMDELISIAAIGRTLGVHLILATQKPAGVVDDKIWSNSRFRICLRVQSEGDSRDMLKIPNAAWITKPGRGYFQVGSDEVFEEMQFAWSGAPYIGNRDISSALPVHEVRLNGKREALLTGGERASSGLKGEEAPKQLQVFIDYIAKEAAKAGIERLQGPWLPPLPEMLDLTNLPQCTEIDSTSSSLELKSLIGLVDDLPNQRQEPMYASLDHGHWAVYGMPGMGKTTFLHTLLMSTAQRYAVNHWNGYIIDMGRTMRDFGELPQIGAVMMAEEDDRIKRLFRYLFKMVALRKEMLSEAGVKTISSFRRSAVEDVPQIVVVIDGYLNFRNAYPDENELLESLLREGGSLGITFIITANRITDVFEKFRSNIPNAVSFELADPSDYYYAVGRPAKTPGPLIPGRALVKGHVPPLEFQTALPSPGEDEAERSAQLRRNIAGIAQGWKGKHAPAILPLPERIPLLELLQQWDRTSGPSGALPYEVPVGLQSDDLEPFLLNLKEGPNFIVGSPMEGGKTSFLMSWIISLAYYTSPDQMQVYTIDTRYGGGGLSRLRHLPHVKVAAESEEEMGPLVQQVHDIVQQRSKDGNDPELLLVIDDADMLSKQLNDFMIKDQLSAIVRLGRDRNVHVVLSGVPADFPTFGVDWFNDVKASQSGMLFGTLDSNDLSFFRIPYSEANAATGGLKVLPPGQGYYVRRKFTRIKAAIPFSEQMSCEDWITKIRDRWHVVV